MIIAAESTRPESPSPFRGRAGLRIPLAILLLVVALLVYANVDLSLAWDDDIAELGRGRLFAYFTTQSNLLAVAAYAIFGVMLLRGAPVGRWMEVVRGLATVDMALTGIVNGLLLADPGAPFSYSEFVLHQGGPVFIVLWWIAMPPARPLPFSTPLIWVAHPLAWAVSTIQYSFESTDHWVPYFFLDPAQVGGWGGVALWLGILIAVQLALGFGAALLSRTPWRHAVWRVVSGEATTRPAVG